MWPGDVKRDVSNVMTIESDGLVQQFRLCSHLIWAELKAGRSEITLDFFLKKYLV